MTVTPPAQALVPRLDPVYVTDDDLEDLRTYTGMGREECLSRLRSYSSHEHERAWRSANPQTQDEITAFYGSTDLYIWELMQWHASTARLPYWHALEWFTRNNPPKDGWRRVLDYGCGVGTDSLYLASQGYDVTATDVEGPSLRFAKHRFHRHRLQARFVESPGRTPNLTDTFDAVVCFDVFEHLPDPLGTARALVRLLRPGGLLLQQATFEDDHETPCHLSAGVARFSGLRWHVELAGLGLSTVGPMALQKVKGLRNMAERGRYLVGKTTGIWLTRVK